MRTAVASDIVAVHMEPALVLLRIALSIVLAAAGAAKLWSGSDRFAIAVAAYRVLPKRAVRPVAMAIPVIEIVCGLWLLSGFEVASASLVAAGLLCGFTGAVALALRRGQRNDCGCGGPGSGPIGAAVITRNVGLIAALVLVAVPSFVGGGE